MLANRRGVRLKHLREENTQVVCTQPRSRGGQPVKAISQIGVPPTPVDLPFPSRAQLASEMPDKTRAEHDWMGYPRDDECGRAPRMNREDQHEKERCASHDLSNTVIGDPLVSVVDHLA